MPVSSNYVAYRGAIPIDDVRDVKGLALDDVVAYIGPRCHFVQYSLRRGEMFNQVAVFELPMAVAGEADWGTPDELDAAFARACDEVRSALPFEWDAALRAYNDTRARRTVQVQRTVRAWGDLWHADGMLRAVRNALLRDRDPADYRYIDWLYAP